MACEGFLKAFTGLLKRLGALLKLLEPGAVDRAQNPQGTSAKSQIVPSPVPGATDPSDSEPGGAR